MSKEPWCVLEGEFAPLDETLKPIAFYPPMLIVNAWTFGTTMLGIATYRHHKSTNCNSLVWQTNILHQLGSFVTSTPAPLQTQSTASKHGKVSTHICACCYLRNMFFVWPVLVSTTLAVFHDVSTFNPATEGRPPTQTWSNFEIERLFLVTTSFLWLLVRHLLLVAMHLLLLASCKANMSINAPLTFPPGHPREEALVVVESLWAPHPE